MTNWDSLSLQAIHERKNSPKEHRKKAPECDSVRTPKTAGQRFALYVSTVAKSSADQANETPSHDDVYV